MRVGVGGCSGRGTRWQTWLISMQLTVGRVALVLRMPARREAVLARRLGFSGCSVHTGSLVLKRIGMIKVKDDLCSDTKTRCNGVKCTWLAFIASVVRSSVPLPTRQHMGPEPAGRIRAEPRSMVHLR